jgi:hypothetical protein
MSREFGWAYVAGSQASGPKGSVQIAGDGSALDNDANLVWRESDNALLLTGSLRVSGSIYAHTLEVRNETQTVFHFEVSGSSNFGDTNDDIHQFTGSIELTGNLSSSGYISASSFHGDGTNLEGVAINTFSNYADNRLITGTGAKSLQAETNLLFDGTLLTITGNIDMTGDINTQMVTGTQFSGTTSQFTTSTTQDLTASNITASYISASTGDYTALTGSDIRVGDLILFGRIVDGTDGTVLFQGDTTTGPGDMGQQVEVQTVSAAGTGFTFGTSVVHKSDFSLISTGFSVGGDKLFVNDDTDRVGIGTKLPANPFHIVDSNGGAQVKISSAYNPNAFGFVPHFTDLETNAAGGFSISPSSKFFGINKTTPTVALDVSGSGFIEGDLDLSGTLDISASANPIKVQGLQPGTGVDQSSYLALDSNYNLVLTSAAGSGTGGTIGPAEDGTYTDGLFADFQTTTAIGTAIDKFNEILKIIVPGPAPSVDQINYINTSGIGTKLTFNTAEGVPSGYTHVGGIGEFSSTPAVNDQYTVSTSGEDFRLGVYDGSQEVTGVINHQVAEELKSTQVNYSFDSFGNAESGSLKLYLNNALVHTLDLNGFTGSGNPNTGSASSLNGNGSGFFDVSTLAAATDQNGSTYDIFKHRTAKFVIDPTDQNKGWNYAKIEHVYGATTYTTNFIQWFNDTDASSNSMTLQNPRVTFVGGGSKYLSGVEYFRSAALTYSAEVANFYKHTYPTGNVLTFNNDSLVDAVSSQAAPALGDGEDFTKLFEVTGSTDTNDNIVLNGSTTLSLNLTHPLKTNLSSTGSVTTSQILIYNSDTANSNTVENFELENYRITSGSYSTQSSVTAGVATWQSNEPISDSGGDGHPGGLMYYNSRLYSPLEGANGGNFGALSNGPAGNQDYSSLSGTRTFYRKVQNLTGSPVYDMKITTTKNTRINNSSLSTNNVKFFIKNPATTGWMDISQNFTYGSTSDDSGALISTANDNTSTSSTSTSNSVHCITFGIAPIANNEYVVIRIEADASWDKYIETIQFQLGASDVSAPTQAPALDDLDLNNDGEAGKLSFGASNTISGYTNVSGAGTGSMSDYDSNEHYPDDNDDRRGIFGAFETMLGNLNEDVTSNGSNYGANAFSNAYSGSLILEVNGSEVSTLDLESSRSSINNISSNTGLSVSAVVNSTTTDGIPDYFKSNRNGTFSVGTSIQRKGWNYARVIHRTGADVTTNYVEWVSDPDGAGAPMTATNVAMSDFNHSSVYYQSGIGYFASQPSGSYTYDASEVYKNVYNRTTSAVSFPTTTNCSITGTTINGTGVSNRSETGATTRLPSLNDTANCQDQIIRVTGSVQFDSLTSISGGLGLFTDYDVTVSSQILHPLKSTLSVSSASKTSFMVYSGSIGSTTANDREDFNTETYRLVTDNYATQADVTDSGNAWNSQTEMNNGGTQDDGLVMVNGFLISPLKIGDAGDTRNTSDGGSLQAPAGNPNYSSLSQATRTFYRYFRNPGPTSLNNFSITVTGDATIVAKQGSVHYGALGANDRINIEMKLPGVTAWGDCAIPQGGVNPTSDGNGIFNGGNGNLDQDASDGSTIAITLGSLDWLVDDYIVLKITAHKDWTGYLTQITAAY